jgi:transcriptional regulator with XRE-family HTH domain
VADSRLNRDNFLTECRELSMIVKNLRDQHKWSQEQLAELCGLNVRTIQRVESGSKASL